MRSAASGVGRRLAPHSTPPAHRLAARGCARQLRRTWDVLLWDNPNLRRIRLGPEWLLIQRLQWGLYSVLALLEAQGRFDQSFARWIASPTVEGVPPA